MKQNRCKDCHWWKDGDAFEIQSDGKFLPCTNIGVDGWEYWLDTQQEPEDCDGYCKRGEYVPSGVWAGVAKKIIDVCCGGRAFWFDKENPNVEFCDIRNEGDIQLCNGQTIRVAPDTICDFTNLPFEDNTYYLAVFDPPHLIGKRETAWMVKKYGSLPADGWQDVLAKGFSECMRVLKPNGVLIFKWNEVEIPLSKILQIFGKQPLFGHSSGKRMNTHWVCFMKEA